MEFIFEDTEQSAKRKPYSSPNTISQPSIWAAPADSVDSNPLAKRRNVPASVAEVEIAPNPRRKRKTANVNYLKTVKTPKKKAKSKEKFVWTWNKIGWLVCFGVFLRLIFMDRGVAHYYQMQDTLKAKKAELEMVKEENAQLVTEINRIKVDPGYQKKVAREHLGVIARDEYLILFATDGNPQSI